MHLNHSTAEAIEIQIPESFRGFDKHAEIHTYHRYLPHWRQKGATYFVTFRQADSIPKEVLIQMKNEADLWKERLSIEAPIQPELRREYDDFLTRRGQRLDDALDACHGSCQLHSTASRKIVADALLCFNEVRYEIYAAVVMPNHCHVLVRPFEDHPLENILQGWKGYTAQKINEEINRSGNFWQEESHDRIVRNTAHFQNAARYVLKNPAKANLSVSNYWAYCNRQKWGSPITSIS
ncbi:MAG: transposase [Verrucomicrobiales bacterium]|nr:transposase [Verrucomicrobiales bacterium]